MLELLALNAAKNGDNKKPKTEAEKRAEAIATAIVVVIWLAFWIWAIFRALKCSSATPDSRALHLFFATASPVLYIIFSFSVSGFCPK